MLWCVWLGGIQLPNLILPFSSFKNNNKNQRTRLGVNLIDNIKVELPKQNRIKFKNIVNQM